MRKATGRLIDLAIDWFLFCTVFNTIVSVLLELTK